VRSAASSSENGASLLPFASEPRIERFGMRGGFHSVDSNPCSLCGSADVLDQRPRRWSIFAARSKRHEEVLVFD
jgi:hypothetical protein